MRKLNFNLKLNTLSPVGNFSEFAQHTFVYYKDYIYFLDTEKLSKILSLMRYLLDFCEYENSLINKNITPWLYEKKLLSVELLEELCLYKLPSEEYSKKIFRFFRDVKFYNNPELIKNYFSQLLEKGFENILLYSYFLKNSRQMNKYLEKLLDFLDNNSQKLNFHSLDFSIKSIFEIDKQIFNYNYLKIKKLSLKSECKKYKLEDLLCLQPISIGKQTHIQECIRVGQESFLEMANVKYDIFNDFKDIAHSLNTNLSKNYSNENKENIDFNTMNLHLLNSIQIFYLALSVENRQRLNQTLKKVYSQEFEEKIAYFDLRINNEIKNLNYVKLTIL